MTEKTKANLTGVPETMLWTLHNRVSCPGTFKDARAEEIYQALDYDFVKSFGPADGSHAARSRCFDGLLRDFAAQHPDGVIVNLGEGLETQRYRVEGDQLLWISVDLPESIAIRERFIQPDDQHLHIAQSALETAWMDAVPADRPVYFTAQGLLMYFTEDQVRAHLQALSARFPGARYAFDAAPPWLTKKTLREGGWMKTPSYRVPPCPWGIQRNKVEPTLRAWLPARSEIEVDPFPRFPKEAGFMLYRVYYWISHTPGLRELGGTVVRLRF